MRHAQRGASMIEFTVAAMTLLLLIFGIIEFGRALYMYHTVSNAARIGARWAIVRGSKSCSGAIVIDHCNAASSDVQTYVQSVVPLVDNGSLAITASWPGGNTGCSSSSDFHAQGCVVAVQVTYLFKSAIPLISNTTFNLSSTSQMVISR